MNEKAVISGGIEVATHWELYSARTDVFSGTNNIFEGIEPHQSTASVAFLGVFDSAETCQLICKHVSTCSSYTYFGKDAGKFANLCYGRLDGKWNPIKTAGAISGKKVFYARIYLRP